MNINNSLSVGPVISPISTSLAELSFVPDCSKQLTEATFADTYAEPRKARLWCQRGLLTWNIALNRAD